MTVRVCLIAISLVVVGCGEKATPRALTAADVSRAFAHQGVALRVDFATPPAAGSSVVMSGLSRQSGADLGVRGIYVLEDAKQASRTAANVPPSARKQLASNIMSVRNVVLVVDAKAGQDAIRRIRSVIAELEQSGS